MTGQRPAMPRRSINEAKRAYAAAVAAADRAYDEAAAAARELAVEAARDA